MSHGEAFVVVKGRVPSVHEKRELYQNVIATLAAMLEGETEPTVLMASITSVLHQSMPHYFWTGFYRVFGEELLIGPYQGTPGCLRIALGRGVCGSAWQKQETVVVKDVHAFPGHIACDARSASEIVVPWRNRVGDVVAVLDVDSDQAAAFDEIDQEMLEQIARAFRLG